MPDASRCRWCGYPAEFLCDAVLVPRTATRPAVTCDAPMCRDHRLCKAKGFVRRGLGQSGTFSIDLCPDHAPGPQPPKAA